jgi:hypothetical protein
MPPLGSVYMTLTEMPRVALSVALAGLVIFATKVPVGENLISSTFTLPVIAEMPLKLRDPHTQAAVSPSTTTR